MSKTAKSKPLADHSLAADIYLEAMEMPPDERRRFIQQKVRENPALESLLPDDLSRFMAKPVMAENPAPRLTEGKRIGDFEVEKRLGQGGFATVYLARQLSLDRRVALKVSPNEGQEARILAHIEHDHIVKVFSETTDAARDLRLICMQYVCGATLAEVIRSMRWDQRGGYEGASIADFLRRVEAPPGETPPRESALERMDLQGATLWIGTRLARALSYAHERGVLHLDVKPSNILLDRSGKPFLTDFNVSIDLARARAGGEHSVGGTLDYMPPEQLAMMEAAGKGERVPLTIDHRADVYSLGMVLKELVGSVSSVQGNAQTRVLKDASIIENGKTWTNWRSIDAGVRLVLNKSTARSAEARFSSAALFAEALDACLELRTILQRLPSPGGLLGLWRRLPFFSLAVFWTLPQLLATAMGLAYLYVTCGEELVTEPATLVGIACGFALVSLLWFVRLYPLWRYLAKPARSLADPNLGRQARARVRGLSGGALALLAWFSLPAQIASLLVTGDLSREILSRVLLACGLSGLLGASYAAAASAAAGLLALYPRLWIGRARIRATAEGELDDFTAGMRIPLLGAALVPMAMAALVFFDPRFPAAWRMPTVGALLALGAFGILFAFRASHQVARFVFAFTGK